MMKHHLEHGMEPHVPWKEVRSPTKEALTLTVGHVRVRTWRDRRPHVRRPRGCSKSSSDRRIETLIQKRRIEEVTIDRSLERVRGRGSM